MKLIIAGSRTITDYEIVRQAYLDSGFKATLILSGKAKGVDTLGEQLAREFNIPIAEYPAQWNLLGRKAGYVRNVQMANDADALMALWDGRSKGTKHMIQIATTTGLIVKVRYI